VQKVAGFTIQTPENYPKGHLSGYEIEVRQKLTLLEKIGWSSVGANATS